ALATNRPYVKLRGTTDEAVTVLGGRIVTFLAEPNGQLTRSSGTGAIVTIEDDNTSLSIFDLTIANAPNSPSGIGCVIPTAAGSPSLALTRAKIINNPGGGVSVSGGTLTVSQSIITANIGGGILVTTATFDITNSFIVRNGNPTTATIGGASLLPAVGP